MRNSGSIVGWTARRVRAAVFTASLATGLAASVAACVQEPVIPKIDTPPIALSLFFSTKTFTLGKSDTISVTATNNFETAATIRFPSDCQIVVTIRSQAGAAVVPPGGMPSCINLATTLTIPAGGAVVRRFIWNGATDFLPPGSATPLPPGAYFISAAINASNYSTVAPAVRVDLVSATP
ncbi:MAG: hypothetical protein ABIZ91_03320 [Gemmatimonadaceae bacterium]